MSRARNIKPGFFENEDLAECSAHARLLFIGLWTLADRRGVLEDRPRRIGGAIFRYEQVDCEALLTELEDRGFIRRYRAGDTRCILIPNFVKHQNPHMREQANDLPLPDEHRRSTVLAPDKHGASLAESPILNPESPIPLTETEDPPTPQGDSFPVEFVEFWDRYPKGHGSRAKSYREWRKVRAEHGAIMAGLDAWLISERWQKGMVKTAELWLRDRLWENPAPPGNGGNGQFLPGSGDAAYREWRRNGGIG